MVKASGYETKCQNMLATGDGTQRKCGLPARLCECPDGFNEHPSASETRPNNGEWCKCGNRVPDGFPVTRRKGGLMDGTTIESQGYMTWPYRGECQTCVRERLGNERSAARSKVLTAELALMGNPWHDMDKIVQMALHSVCVTMGFPHYWLNVPIAPKPVMPKTILYRVQA